MSKVLCTCHLCGEKYWLVPSLAKRNKYCGKLCHNRANARNNAKKFKGPTHWNYGKHTRLTTWAVVQCRFCLEKFECEPNEYKHGRKFCGKTCANAFQTSRGENAKKIWIRESINLFSYPCQKCGSNAPKIDVHHIDRNRGNNPADGSNWIRLCDKCHKLIHFAMKKRAPIISKEEFLSDAFTP